MVIILKFIIKKEEFFRKRFFELSSHLPKKEEVNFIESRIKKQSKFKEVMIKIC